MKRSLATLGLALALGLLISACGGAQPATLLEQIEQRGTILVSTDPNYAPQSVLKADAARTAGTQCASAELTAGEMEGFDVDVAIEIGNRLGVETCFVTPSWDAITAGNWGGQWDISVGSMTITSERQQILDFTTPYYFTPAQFAAAENAGIDSVDDFSGKTVCLGTATTYEEYMAGIDMGPGVTILTPPPADVTVVTLETDQECAQAIAAGRTEFVGYLTSATVVEQNISQGVPVVRVGEPVFLENLAVAIDKAHTLDRASLVSRVDEIVRAMHADGTLTQLSEKWFGIDLTDVSG